VLTRDTLELVVTAVTYIVLGMFLGNLILITLGLAPLVFLAFGVLIPQPHVTSAERRGKDVKVNVDDNISDKLTVTLEGGPGVITLADVLPRAFKLDEGTNFKAIWKGFAPRTVDFAYMATCAKRGFYELREINWEVRQPLQIADNAIGTEETKRTILVQPTPLLVRKVREHKGLSKIPMPIDARFRFGVPTTDFKEIRDYVSGDAYKMINWKASAKNLSMNRQQFMVNEYEKEGKKVVWLFLDCASSMALGTTVNNAMEYAIRAALGFTTFYVNRDCRVGFCVYNNDSSQWEGTFQSQLVPEAIEALEGIDQMEDLSVLNGNRKEGHGERYHSRLLFPDVGKRQQYKITRELLHVDIRYSSESLKEAIHSCRRYIVGTRPLFVIVTMIQAGKIQGIVDGIKELHRYMGRISGRPSIIVFNVQGYSVAAQTEEEKIAAGLLSYHTKPFYDIIRGLGCIVVNWDPADESFAQALQRQRV